MQFDTRWLPTINHRNHNELCKIKSFSDPIHTQKRDKKTCSFIRVSLSNCFSFSLCLSIRFSVYFSLSRSICLYVYSLFLLPVTPSLCIFLSFSIFYLSLCIFLSLSLILFMYSSYSLCLYVSSFNILFICLFFSLTHLRRVTRERTQMS